MDADLWHRQAVAAPIDLPAPVETAVLAALSVVERRKYADEVRAALRARPLPSRVHQRAARALDAALESALLEPSGARTILALSAPFAAGKSTLVKQWAQERYRSWSRTRSAEVPRWRPVAGVLADHIPVCYLTLLSESRSKDLYSQILTFLGHPASGVERTLALRAVAAMRTHGVRLLILDDAHMLRTSSVTGRATLNAVKHLNTELGEIGGVLMLVGAELSTGDVLGDPQIRGRLAEHALAPYEVDSEDGRAHWQTFLKHCEQQILPYLPCEEAGVFASRHAGYIWRRTQGYVGDATHLLIDATAVALATDVPLSKKVLDPVPLSQRARDAYEELERRVRAQHGRSAG